MTRALIDDSSLGDIADAIREKGGTEELLRPSEMGAAIRALTVSSFTESDPTVPSWAKAAHKPTYTASEVGALPATTHIPSRLTDLTNDAGFVSSVPSWALSSRKPTYTASEVGALPATTTIPSRISDLQNDSGLISVESDPTVPAWAKSAHKPAYTASEVGALPASTTIPSRFSDLDNDMSLISRESIDGVTISRNADGSLYAIGAVAANEIDPTVPSWAKQPTKPTYTASEVGALPATTTIPSNVTDLNNDAGFISSLPLATSSVPGVMMVGSGLSFSGNGTVLLAFAFESITSSEISAMFSPSGSASVHNGYLDFGSTATVSGNYLVLSSASMSGNYIVL